MKFSKIKLQMVKEENFNYNSKTIKSARDIVKTINEFEELEKSTEEHTILICLNVKNQIVAYTELAKGGINYCNLDFKTIFKTVLLSNSSKIILVHNHPAGGAVASKNDINVTRKLRDTAKLMDVELLDHIIVADNDFVSCMS